MDIEKETKAIIKSMITELKQNIQGVWIEMSKKIYCISNGDYENWSIAYAFESEEKRDKLYKVLCATSNDYDKYDLKLNDRDDKISQIKNVYYAKLSQFDEDIDIDFRVGYDYREEFNASIDIFSSQLYYITLPITEEEYNKKDKDKYVKVLNDYKAKVKYMIEVEGMSIDEVEEMLNK